MNETQQKQLRAWILVIGVLLILILFTVGILLTIRQGMRQVQQVVDPFSGISRDLGTQVSQVLHPTPTILPDPVTVIYQVRSLARLETIQYTVEKVITAETGQNVLGPLFGDKLIFVAHGIVIAGIDLQKIGSGDMWTQNGVLYVRLPEPEVFMSTLDNQKSYVYNRQTGLLTKGDINLETQARQVAEQEIEKAAMEDGILDQANQNAESYMYRLLRQLGYPEVIFVKPTPTPAP